jgi:hypothetical protein
MGGKTHGHSGTVCRMLSVTLWNVDSRLSLLVQTLEFAEMGTYGR